MPNPLRPAAAALLLCALGAAAEKEGLKVSDPLPELSAKDENGKDLKLTSFKGAQGVVLFFYPKAFTGG